ncbi:DUF5655 domain-containing protein [Devosia algicola]|uniref:DUF5655 domain-containing protein n=1 Tax=Devosia algicola TaxID=3026418 RepID=A0ABY7YSN1_9HYPH|nr:DUF5655 domain-containing protein [Devosia algicola]WDR04343.1 DUF5655 domain-containing protein [Devosia algicola]
MTSLVSAYLKDKNDGAISLFNEFRDAALAAGTEVEEKVSKTMVAWKGKRTFATAYVKGKYLECTVDLLHAIEHKHLKASFPTTKKVVTNRFTLEPGETVDEQMTAWLKEGFEDVGPGTGSKS